MSSVAGSAAGGSRAPTEGGLMSVAAARSVAAGSHFVAGGHGAAGGGGMGMGYGGGYMGAAAAPPPSFHIKEVAAVGLASGNTGGGGGASSGAPGSGGGAAGAGGGGAPHDGPAGRTKAIAAVQFGTMSPAEMMRLATIQVCSRELYKMPTRSPAPYSSIDTRLGISQKSEACGTCGKKLQDCAGHFGFIKLELPVYHIGFFKAVVEIVQNICKSCSRVLLGPVERKGYLRLMRNPGTDALRKVKIRKRISEACKKVTCCPWCGALNGPVKRVPGAQAFRLIHERYGKDYRKDELGRARMREAFEAGLEGVSETAPEIAPHIGEN